MKPFTPFELSAALRRSIEELRDRAISLPLLHLDLADRIAVVLNRDGCRVDEAISGCPASEYIRRRLGLGERFVVYITPPTDRRHHAGVTPARVVVMTAGKILAEEPLPAILWEFCSRFDSLRYPELSSL